MRAANDGAVARFTASLGVTPAAARVFAARGATTSFFHPTVNDLHDFTSLLGIDRAVDRIHRAIREGEHIRLVTDYDVDGTTSCLILQAALERAGAGQVSYHQPDRFTEGYGLSQRAVEHAKAAGVTLLITADIGVRDHASVSRARQLGIDVLIVDHHLPAGENVPADAFAVLCPPQVECPYPNKSLAACGVSLKLATAILTGDPRRDDVLASMMKLAAIGTVADVVDIFNAENRAIVSLGLRALNGGRHSPGLQALLDVSGAKAGAITAATLGWQLGPRINAAGRLADAGAVIRLLRERDPASAVKQAQVLDELNRERRDIQEKMTELAMARVGDDPPPFVVVWGSEEEGFHRGVVGIVASKVRDRIDRPVAVVSVLGNVATGSVRSTPAVHAVKALDAVSSLLVRYGGHAAAAGFTVATSDLPRMAMELADYVSKHIGDAEMAGEEDVDAEIEGRAVSLELAHELARLEPCGKGNPKAKLVVNGAISGLRMVKDKHAFFNVGGAEAVWWGIGERVSDLTGGTAVLGEVISDEYQGRVRARVVVEDVG